MKNNRNLLGLLLLLAVFTLACSGERYKYVNANVVEIEYYDSIKTDEWILIDGIKFEHNENYERTKEDSTLVTDFYEMKILPSTIQDIIIEAGKTYEVTQVYDDATMVYELFKRLAMMNDEDGNRKYSFLGNTLSVATGKIKFERLDGEKIKVSTSEGYGAAVRKIE